MNTTESKVVLKENVNNSLLQVIHNIETKEEFPGIKSLNKEIEISFSPDFSRFYEYKIEFEEVLNFGYYYLGKTNYMSDMFLVFPRKGSIKIQEKNNNLNVLAYFKIKTQESKRFIFFPMFFKDENGILVEKRIHNILNENPSLVWMENASKIEELVLFGNFN